MHGTTTFSPVTRPERNAPVLTPDDDRLLVSAIVSTYDSADLIEGCIRDLERQTLAGRMEIIVIDSASPGNEGEIVRRLQGEFGNIRYLRTPQRETVYKAWNRGIRLARGRYLTNANTDDRRRPDAIEVLVNTLESNLAAVLAYGNFNVVNVPGHPFSEIPPVKVMDYPPYRRGDLLLHCYPGPMPVWRRSVHKEFGLFNPDFVSAGDREFWVRISQKYDMIRVPEVLGDYYDNAAGISNSNIRAGVAQQEGHRITLRYRDSFARPWGGLRDIKLRVKDNFPDVKHKIEELAVSGGGFRLSVLLHSCTLAEWAWLAGQKVRGVIYELHEDHGFRVRLEDAAPDALAGGVDGPPRVSLLFFSYDRIEYTRASLQALIDNTAYPFELHVVDNGSKDGTPDYLMQMQGLYPEVIRSVTLNPENRGLPIPTNEFWSASNADYLGKVDNDTVVPSGWLQKLVHAHERLPELGVVAAYHFPLDEFDEAGARSRILERDGVRLLLDSHVGGCAYLLKRSAQRNAGLMQADPQRKIMGWTEYQHKLARMGYRIGYYFPLIALDYLDDPRNERCLIDSKYLDYSKKIWRERGVTVQSSRDIDTWLRRDSRRISSGNGASRVRQDEPALRPRPNTATHAALAETARPAPPSTAPVNGSTDRKRAMNANKKGNYYVYERQDVAALVPRDALKILDVGCGGGGLANTLKHQNPNRWIAGVEINERAAQDAVHVVDRLIREDIEAWQPDFAEGEFDCIIFADILEHLVDPYTLVARLRRFLKPGGSLVISLPNIRNFRVIDELISGRWRYRDAGIMDNTHLRFFTRAEITRMLTGAGYRVDATERVYTKKELVENWKRSGRPPELTLGRATLRNLAPEEIEDLLTEQHLVRAVNEVEPTVSIVIPSFNQAAYTEACVRSVLESTRVPFEVIVVDNGSRDDTVTRLNGIADARVRVLANRENLGFGPACNQGIREARGRFVMLLNNDTLVTEGWLERLVTAAEKDEQIGLVGAMTNYIGHAPQMLGPAPYADGNGLRLFADKVARENSGQVAPVERLVFFATLIRREVFDSIGLLDEKYAIGNYEDDDFCWRARTAGWILVAARDAYVHHFGSKTFKGQQDQELYRRMMAANGQRFFQKWGLDPKEYERRANRTPLHLLVATELEGFLTPSVAGVGR